MKNLHKQSGSSEFCGLEVARRCNSPRSKEGLGNAVLAGEGVRSCAVVFL